MEGVPKFKKSRSCDKGQAPLDPNLHFCLVPLRILLRAKFGVSSYVLYGDMEAVPKFKSRSRDPGHAAIDPNLHFCLVPLRILLRAKFGISSFTRSGDMEGSQNLKVGQVTQATPF